MLVKYKKYSTPYTTYTLNIPLDDNGNPKGVEHCTLEDGYTYVGFYDVAELPEQPEEIFSSIELAELTPELKEKIKSLSPHCKLIAERVQQRLRSKFSLDDELYLNRIHSGSLAGMYQLQSGEQDMIIAFAQWVEECRQWGRNEREKLGIL